VSFWHCHALPCLAILKAAVVEQAASIPHDSLLTAVCGANCESDAVVACGGIIGSFLCSY